MGGYSPSSTGFSLALKRIGDRLKARFGNEVDIKYVYNVLDLGYREDDLNWMVEDGVLTLAYQSSGYFTNQVPDLGVADLPYLFPNVQAARAAIDRLGQALGARRRAVRAPGLVFTNSCRRLAAAAWVKCGRRATRN